MGGDRWPAGGFTPGSTLRTSRCPNPRLEALEDDDTKVVSRSPTLSSEKLGVVAKIDIAEAERTAWSRLSLPGRRSGALVAKGVVTGGKIGLRASGGKGIAKKIAREAFVTAW